MRLALSLSISLLVASVAAAAHAANPAAGTLNSTEIAVYVPPSALAARTYIPRLNLWIEPGKALSDALNAAGNQYFQSMHLVPDAQDQHYGLLFDLAPKWSVDGGKVHLVVKYVIFAADRSKVLEGTIEKIAPVKGGNLNAAASTASSLAMQQVMFDVQGRLKPDPSRFPANGSTAKIDFAPLVDHEKPLRTGTAFYVNKSGQLLTAAHISRDCSVLEAHEGDATFAVTTKASSDLLDVAVLDSGKTRTSALPLRDGNAIMLGESITSVGYPLQGLLGDSPNLTRGNISASKGIRGSMGLFQFSAPIQPGNSGGPIVSDNGELLGMAVSTLNAQTLAKDGLIPQNVNFALDAKYVAAFLHRQGVAFETIRVDGVGSMQTANQAALSNTVQLNCYQ